MKPTKIYSDTIEQGALDQFTAAMALPCVIQGALMPDSHQGYALPIGAVVKTKDEVFPSFVGYDIGCGVACLILDINYKLINLELLKQHILDTIPIGFNCHAEVQPVEDIDSTGVSKVLEKAFLTKGLKQIGTLGGGNHFIEVGYLESTQNIAVVIHSGSRGFGHTVASYYMQEAASMSATSGWDIEWEKHVIDFKSRNHDWWAIATSAGLLSTELINFDKAMTKYVAKQKAKYMKNQDVEGLHSFNINSDIGKAYITDQNFCLEYALANRKAMLQKIVGGVLAQIPIDEDLKIKRLINRNHNHAELIDGYIIHRKGATHAEKGMYGVIPGNMRDGSFIVKGKGNPDSMSSSSHGAGRVLSRKQAIAQLNVEDFKAETAKLVTNHTEKMLDEAPKAYKNIFEVMELQSDLVEVVGRVIPILNIKG